MAFCDKHFLHGRIEDLMAQSIDYKKRWIASVQSARSRYEDHVAKANNPTEFDETRENPVMAGMRTGMRDWLGQN